MRPFVLLALLLFLTPSTDAAYPRGYRASIKVRNVSDGPVMVTIETWPDGETVMEDIIIYGKKGVIRGLRERTFYRLGADGGLDGTPNGWTAPFFLKKRTKVYTY